MGQDAPWESNKLSHGAFFYPPPANPESNQAFKGPMAMLFTLPPDANVGGHRGLAANLSSGNTSGKGWWVLAS
jgi:hypothetical protein